MSVCSFKAAISPCRPPVEQVAENAGTIPYELLCGVSQRVRLDVI